MKDIHINLLISYIVPEREDGHFLGSTLLPPAVLEFLHLRGRDTDRTDEEDIDTTPSHDIYGEYLFI